MGKQNKTKVTKKFKLQDSLKILIFLKMLLFMRHANLNQVIKSPVSPVFRQLRFLQISKCVRLKKSPKESILLKTLKSNNHIYLITISLGLTCGAVIYILKQKFENSPSGLYHVASDKCI